MTSETPGYTTNLSKAQGIVPETRELLEIWEPGMETAELKKLVRETGALSKSTSTRVDDVVGRGFAQRYLVDDAVPARRLKTLQEGGASARVLAQLFLLYTARANAVFHDFLRETFWPKYSAGALEIAKPDARDFLERSVSIGRISPRWSDSMMERVSRYLMGTLGDFSFIRDNRPGERALNPVRILPETALYLAYDLHFGGLPDSEVASHRDWELFGLTRPEIARELHSLASKRHLQVQEAGGVIRIEWYHDTFDEIIDEILERKV